MEKTEESFIHIRLFGTRIRGLVIRGVEWEEARRMQA